MKYIIKYKLENGKIPSYIDDGGYYPDGKFLYGFTIDLDKPPVGLDIIEPSVFKNYVISLNIQKPVMQDMDITQKTEMIDSQLNLKNISTDINIIK